MGALYAYSERVVPGPAIGALPDGRYEAEDVVEAGEGELDGPGRGGHRRRRAGDRLRGHRAQYRGNLNCPLAVTRSACFFVVRA